MRCIPAGNYDSGNDRNSERGVVLIIVLLMISLIIAVTVKMVRSSRADYYEAVNMRDSFKTRYLAKSGFYRAEAALAEDENGYDALFEKWAKSDVISTQAGTMFDDGGYFTASIEDESGRININKLVDKDNVANKGFNQPVKDMLMRLLARPEYKLEEQQRTDIVNAIKDYIDADSDATGKEKGTMEPLWCKNAPLDSIEELLLIPLISNDLFYGTKEKPGISRYLTVYGDGKININTAPAAVLKSLVDNITDDQVAAMEDYRMHESQDLADPGWYHKISGMSGANIDPNLLSTRSRVFRITSTGFLGKMGQTITGVVQKGSTPKDMKILSWKVY